MGIQRIDRRTDEAHGLGVSHAGSWRHRPGWCGTNWRRARLRPALEGFDDDHVPAAARTGRPRLRQFDRFIWLCWRRHREQLSDRATLALRENPANASGRPFREVLQGHYDEIDPKPAEKQHHTIGPQVDPQQLEPSAPMAARQWAAD